jgi:phage/plasmid-associated DNA primase
MERKKVVTLEPEDEDRPDFSGFMEMTGGDTMTVRNKEDEEELEANDVVFVYNSLPRFSSDEESWRRVMFVRFKHRYYPRGLKFPPSRLEPCVGERRCD